MRSTLVVMLEEDTAVCQTVFAGEQYKWLGSKLADRVIVVANGLKNETVVECERLAARYNLKFVVKG